MEPTSSERAGLNLPAPQNEQAAVAGGSIEGMPSAPEQASQPAQTMPSGQPTAGAPAPAFPLPTTPQAGVTGATSDVSNTTPITVPAVADDQDLIEKEWVNKAKQIVNATRDDPYQQSKELTVFKADYMKKRYNKSLKLSE